jgi:serine/threonine protein kinase
MATCPQCAAVCDDAHSFCAVCGASLGTPEERAKADVLIDHTLPGGYRVTHLIGVGGMGRVYCAEQVALGRTVAVKVVHPHLVNDEMACARFLNEARTASRMSHPNSVAIYDFGRTAEGQPYIVMEYLRGRDLGRVVDAEGPLPPRRSVWVLRQTLAALEEAHALGIVHRDLKPDNIVLEPMRSGVDFVKVVDFGLAKFFEDGPSDRPGAKLTRPGLVCGTPEYMSPEQGRGDPIDGRSDLYAVGVVLFELLAGRVPFVADTATKTLLMHLTELPPDPRNVAPDRNIHEALARVALRALSKMREERFQSAREMSDALDAALATSEGRPRHASGPKTGIRCRSCGVLNPPAQKFCGECGASTSASPSPHPSVITPGPASAGGPASGRSAEGAPASKLTTPVQRVTGSHALPLLDRDPSLEWLEARRHQAGAMMAAAHVVGDTGMGKTRLLGEFLVRCAARGDLVVSVTPDPTWTKIMDHVVREAVRGLGGLPEKAVDPSAWASAAESAQHGLAVLFGPADKQPSLSPAERRRALAEALRWAIEQASARARGLPVILAVDDLDFIDGTSRNAFVDLMTDPPIVSALVVVTYAAPGAPAMAPLEGEVHTLAPLSPEACASVRPGRTTTAPVALSPLHLEQLLAWARESADPPPDRVADVIARRTERLKPDARHALHALAIWGDLATPDSLRRLLPDTLDLDGALDALDRARLVAIDDHGIRVSHPLVRRVVQASIPAERKRELFALAARARPDAPIEVRARQAMHGGGALEALSLLDTLSGQRAAAGDLLGSVSALRHALDVARRALHHDDLDDPTAAVLVFARKLAEALSAMEHFGDAEGVLREALDSAPPSSEHRARLLGALAQVAHSRRNTRDARRYLAEAIRVARQSDAAELLPLLERLDKAIAVA